MLQKLAQKLERKQLLLNMTVNQRMLENANQKSTNASSLMLAQISGLASQPNPE